jgi:hypothetical protein
MSSTETMTPPTQQTVQKSGMLSRVKRIFADLQK